MMRLGIEVPGSALLRYLQQVLCWMDRVKKNESENIVCAFPYMRSIKINNRTGQDRIGRQDRATYH